MARRSCIFFLSILILSASGCMPNLKLFKESWEPLEEYVLEGTEEGKVLVLSLKGVISDTPKEGLLRSRPGTVQEIVSRLRRAEKDRSVAALVLMVDSPGGPVTASDILYHEILSFKKKTGAKVVAILMNLAASGGYYVSLSADYIVAHPTTVTGSVGVIFIRPVLEGLMDKIGVGVQISKSGKNKDMGSPFRKPTEEEERIFQNLTQRLGERFVELVAAHRKIPADALVEVETARVFSAEDARRLGLIDGIGYMNDALGKAKELAGLHENARVVVYRRAELPDDTVYNTTWAMMDGLPLEILDPLPAGFYYLWSP